MAQNTLDSDLYGDIYGDEENDFEPTHEQEHVEQDAAEGYEESNAQTSSSAPTVDEAAGSSALPQDTHRSLPPKPSVSSPSLLSYSAQVAKQFSAYQQTPSQERQQRKEIPLPQNPRPNSGRPSFTVLSDRAIPSGMSNDTVFGKKPSEMHDAGKMFIGGLNWDTTDEGLRDYFSQFGKVDACTIMRDAAGTSRGFAFLTFEDPNAVDLVVNREHALDGKTIDPKRAIPREEHLRNTRYFVGGLSPSTTPDSMRQFFAEYGKVVDATVMLDRESGRSKGFGFVTFEDASKADQLVGKPGLILDDKQIEVKAAQPRNQRDQTRTSSVHSSMNSFESFDQQIPSASSMNFAPSNQQIPMSLLYQRSMAQAPLGMMNMNPMMGMMMNGYAMGNGLPTMNMMGGRLEGMPNVGNVGSMGAMHLGVGPVGTLGIRAPGMMSGGPQLGSIRSVGMGLHPVNNHQNYNRVMGSPGPGPARTTSRREHSFHPYAR